MKLNNKGFAITSIIYSMLILFLTLVVLIIGNLASRKTVFDKQKEDILKNFKENEFGYIYKLPSEYQEVKYIESTGTQYINTGVIPNQDTGFEIRFATLNSIVYTPKGGEDGYGAIMGARSGYNTDEFELTTFINDSVTRKGTLRFETKAYDAKIIADRAINYIALKNKIYRANGSTTNLTGTFQSPVPLTVFALNNNGTIDHFGLVRLFNLKLYDKSKIIRNFIPCYRISDNKKGLYDLIENKFYINAASGTSDFEAGVAVQKD